MCTGEQPPFCGGVSHYKQEIISVTIGLSLDVVQNRQKILPRKNLNVLASVEN